MENKNVSIHQAEKSAIQTPKRRCIRFIHVFINQSPQVVAAARKYYKYFSIQYFSLGGPYVKIHVQKNGHDDPQSFHTPIKYTSNTKSVRIVIDDLAAHPIWTNQARLTPSAKAAWESEFPMVWLSPFFCDWLWLAWLLKLKEITDLTWI